MTVPPPADDGGAARPPPAHLGEHIAELREAAGLTVDQVASQTRIRAGLLRAMESGDFAPCGGAVYARGHLRSIAHVVGADPQELVDGYDRMAGQPSPSAARIDEAPHDPAAHVPFAELSDRPPPPLQVTGSQDPTARLPEHDGRRRPALVLPGAAAARERRGSPLLMLGIGVAAVIVLVAGIALAVPKHRGTAPTAVAAPSSSTARPSAASNPASVSPTAPVTLAAAGVNVTVAVSTKASWVHVTGSGGLLVFQGILGPGTSRSFHDAQTLSFVFGYAPAIDLTYNGQHVGPPPDGNGGVVAHATFTSSSTSG